MSQGSGFDEKASFDFMEGDWSVRVEPLGVWCPLHAYYDCPECNPVQEQFQVPMLTAPPTSLHLPIALAPPEVQQAARSVLAPVTRDILADLCKDPRWAAAAARGREVHERAIRLAKGEGISYDEAIQKVLG